MLYLILATLVAGCGPLQGLLPWPYGDQATGTVPAGARSMETAGRGGPADSAWGIDEGVLSKGEDSGPSLPADDTDLAPPPEPLTEAEQRRLDGNVALAALLQARDVDAYASRYGVVVTLPDLMFEFGSVDLTDQGRRVVGDVADILLAQGRGRRTEVGGHTDAIGAELYNLGLSERRAKAVQAALVAEGVSEALLTSVGYGSSEPVAPNSNADGSDNPAGRALNRRVEIIILD